MGLVEPDETAEEPRKTKNTRRLQRRTEAKKYKKDGAGRTLDDGEVDEREEVGEGGAYFGDEVYAVAGTGEGGVPESVYEVRYGGEPERAAEETGMRGGDIRTCEMEDFPKALVAGEANGAAPGRHGALLLGLLPYDENDDVFDEDAGEAPTEEVAVEHARDANEGDARDDGFLSPELAELLRSFAATRGRASGGDEERGTGDGEILTPELEAFLRSSDAARGRAGDGEEMGGKDEDGAGKREGATSGQERGGVAGERAGKKRKRRGGPRKKKYQSDYHEREGKRGGEMGSQEDAPR